MSEQEPEKLKSKLGISNEEEIYLDNIVEFIVENNPSEKNLDIFNVLKLIFQYY